MATVTGFTAERMLDIENGTVVAGLVDLNGDLLLTKRSGEVMNAGRVRGQDFDPSIVPSANTVDKGITRYSTLSENAMGTLNEAAVTPLGLKTFVDDAIADLDPEGTVVPWANVTGKPSTFPPSAHSHSASDISSGTFDPLRLPLATESERGAVERATQAEVNAGTDSTRYVSPLGLATRLAAIPPPVTSWSELTGKPSTFPPSAHSHSWSDLAGAAFPSLTDGAIDADKAPGDFPIGRTIAQVGSGFPISYGIVDTIYINAHRASQIVIEKTSGSMWVRGVESGVWQSWKQLNAWGDLEGKPSTFPPSSHNHSADDITSGLFSIARIPNISNNGSNANGRAYLGTNPSNPTANNSNFLAISPDSDTGAEPFRFVRNNSTVVLAIENDGNITGLAKIASSRVSGLGSAATLNATAGNVANSVVQRNSAGQIGLGTPTSSIHAATKGYVDDLLAASVTLPTVKAGGFTSSVWNRNITGNRRAAWITDANTAPTELGHTSSSLRYKQDVTEYDVTDEQVLAIAPVFYRYKAEVEKHGDNAAIDFGMIAETLENAGMGWALFYGPDENGEPRVEGIHYERAWLALLPAVQRLINRMNDVEQRLAALESN